MQREIKTSKLNTFIHNLVTDQEQVQASYEQSLHRRPENLCEMDTETLT